MYVYRVSPDGFCIVGFYSPDGQWNPESDHVEIRSAAARIHYLNGGVDAEVVGTVVSRLCDLLFDINATIERLILEVQND